MAENEKPLENNGDPGSPSNGGNEDWKAKYEAEAKAHAVTTQQRNMYKNQAEELNTKVENLGKEKDSISAELDKIKLDADKSAKQMAADKKQSEILSKFKPSTKALAEKLGLKLADAEDVKAIEDFEAKLNALDETASEDEGKPEGSPKPKAPPVGSNNRRLDDNPPPKPKTEEDELKEMEDRIAKGEFDNVKL